MAGEALHIPTRIYFDAAVLEATKGLSPRQQLILRCFFTRHHDGHVREACLCRIVDAPELWVVPFVAQLLGEYVLEIHQVIETHLASLDAAAYRGFFGENRAFYLRTCARAVSYWNAYYRADYPEQRLFPGLKVLEHLAP